MLNFEISHLQEEIEKKNAWIKQSIDERQELKNKLTEEQRKAIKYNSQIDILTKRGNFKLNGKTLITTEVCRKQISIS